MEERSSGQRAMKSTTRNWLLESTHPPLVQTPKATWLAHASWLSLLLRVPLTPPNGVVSCRVVSCRVVYLEHLLEQEVGSLLADVLRQLLRLGAVFGR
jgi:hypothetical protein